MTLEQLTPWLFSRTTGGIRWGLETTQELLAGVDDPHRHFHSLHIGGTNGKGSVAAMCESALRARARGGRTGLYTSPHLVRFAERIRVDGDPVSDELLIACAERLRPAIERTGASFFEATTAIAMLCFAEAGVEIAVVEVGLGGRLDATNVLVPLVTAVTNVSRDHAEYLGDSLEAIAAEKAGIFKAGVPAVTAERDPRVLSVLRQRAAEVGAPLSEVAEQLDGVELRAGGAGAEIRYHSPRWGPGLTLSIPLEGGHQAENAVLACELLGHLPAEHRPSWEAVREGLARVRWPGRLQRHRIGSTSYLFDVAHNPAGVLALSSALERMEPVRPLVAVVGILADKEWGEMLLPLAQRVDALILTSAPSAPPGRRWDPEAAAGWLHQAGQPMPRVIPELGAALSRASTLAPHGTVLVTGSVHTVGDALTELGVAVP